MITAAHVVIYSKDAEADRAFFKNVFGFRSVDAGQGWLIFAVPAAEVAFHPDEQNNRHELFLTCDNLKAQMATLGKKGVHFSETAERPWGISTTIYLPGGGMLGLYEPKHPVTFGKSRRKIKSAKSKKTKRR
jgi:catechol 2,3-dioxygenase-like lactoylglutathione lyase family enzyme